MLSSRKKLHQLRQLMQKNKIDYYYIPSRDEHNDEYVPDCWQRRAWVSSFTGSAGDVLVGHDVALLWTDSRYFLQAEKQLDKKFFQLMKSQAGNPSLIEWLSLHCKNKIVGVDPKLIPIRQKDHWQAQLASCGGRLCVIEENLIDQIWKEQPPLPNAVITMQSKSVTGLSTIEKFKKIRKDLLKQQADAVVFTNLDEIAWLFNFRGDDIDYNPLAISYAILEADQAYLFIDKNKLTKTIASQFEKQNIKIFDYSAVAKVLQKMKGTVLVDPNNASWWIENQTASKAHIQFFTSPILILKAVKNPIEQNGMQLAHKKDAIALVKFFHWLDNNWQKGINEVSAADKLEIFRRANTDCLGLSFPSISAFGANGAIVHYQPEKTTANIINDSNLYLIDSGGQYTSGTTDVTRTIHLGIPTAQQKLHYTLVLKGHIALRHAIFPENTCGYQLDALARQFLWQAGLDYGHGTGHGVGCHLCVHEGPQSISPGNNNTRLVPGMMVSNEPGVYLAEKYGIRIENVCQVVTAQQGFNTFMDLTLVPYNHKLIDMSLLTQQEIEWINEYHQLIFKTISAELPEDVRDWLSHATKPL